MLRIKMSIKIPRYSRPALLEAGAIILSRGGKIINLEGKK